MAGSSVATGTRKVNAKTKIKGKKHKHYRPSDIIYVTRKGDKSAPTAQRLAITRWSDAWRVRGHWRKIKGLGKDRLGERCVAGYTWVSDYVKGDGDATVKKYVL